MKMLLLLLLGIGTGAQSLYADAHVFERTQSPHGLCIAQFSPEDMGSIKFFDSSRHKTYGNVFTPNEFGISNIDLVCSWNLKEDRAAVLVYYGTKLSCINLYEKVHDVFKQVKFELPEADTVYKQVHKKPYRLEFSSGGSINAVGPWTNDIVKLVSGDEHDKGDGSTEALLIVLEVRVRDGKSTILKQKLLNPLSETESQAFFEKWGDKYQ
jgi:hypothetical protein